MSDLFSAEDVKQLQDKTIAIIGYQSKEGMSFAHFLRKQGLQVIIGLGDDDDNWKIAQEDGFEVFTIWDAVHKSDVAQVW